MADPVAMRDLVLVLNAGSSSLKFRVYRTEREAVPALEIRGQIEGIGTAYDAVSTRAIEAVTGVNRGLITYHFGSKEALWKAAIDALFAGQHEHLTVAQVRTSELDAASRLTQLIRAFVQYCADRSEVNRIMVQEGTHDNWRLEWIVERHVNPYYASTQALYDEAVAAGIALPMNDALPLHPGRRGADLCNGAGMPATVRSGSARSCGGRRARGHGSSKQATKRGRAHEALKRRTLLCGRQACAPRAGVARTYVNGELRQHSNTRELIFDCFAQVQELTSAFTLDPGDVVFTGTPSGVGAAMNPRRFLKVGDRVRVEIERIGALDNAAVAGATRPIVG